MNRLDELGLKARTIIETHCKNLGRTVRDFSCNGIRETYLYTDETSVGVPCEAVYVTYSDVSQFSKVNEEGFF